MRALRLWLFVVGVMLLAVPGARAQEEEIDPATEPAAQVRFVHAIPEAPAVDIYLDGEQVVSALPSGAATSYGLTRPGEVEVTVRPAGEENAATPPLLEQQVAVGTGLSYTFATAPGEASEASGHLFIDDTGAAAESTVRVVNLMPGQENTSAVIETERVTEPVDFGEASDRVPVEAASPVVTIVDEGGNELAATPPIPLQGEEFYTIFVTGEEQSMEPVIVSYPLSSGAPPAAPTWSGDDVDAVVMLDVEVEAAPVRMLPETGNTMGDMTVPLWLLIDGFLLIVLALGFGWWWQGYRV